MPLVEQAFELLPGWTITETTTYHPLCSYNGADVLRARLKDWSEEYRVGYITGGYSAAGAMKFGRIDANIVAAQDAFKALVETVNPNGKMPEGDAVPGRIYATTLERGPTPFEHGDLPSFQVDRMWLGVRGWIVTAQNGASATLANPITSKGEPYDPKFLEGFARFWTFCYKNGLASASKAALDRQGPEAIEQLTASAAERKRIKERRIILPDIEKLLRTMVDDKFQSVWDFWSNQFANALDVYLRVQENAWENAQGDSYPRWSSYQFFQDYPMMGYYRSFIEKATERDRTRDGDGWRRRGDNYLDLARNEGLWVATALRESFVHKNAYKLSLIIRSKGNLKDARVIRINGGNDFGGEMIFTFEDNAKFTVRNKTVFKISALGRPFEQFPTTFHDVILPSGKPMGTPSEKRMTEIFARTAA